MVDFLQLQKIMKADLEQDRAVKLVTVEGPTLEAAVSHAATLLDVPMRRIEYEITERGSAGFLGTGKKEWVIQAYERIIDRKEKAAVQEEVKTEETVQVVENVDGEAFVHLYAEGAFLKVTPPKGNGRRMGERDARRKLELRLVNQIDDNALAQILQEATGEYRKVGEFNHHPANDSLMNVDITDSEMKAWITLTPPGQGGCDIAAETLLNFLRNNRVVYGVNEDFIREFADNPAYKEKTLAAEGAQPINGNDAYIQYNFETDQTKVHLKEGANGRVDFKDLNIIQNVVANQPLAKKVPPETGVVGRTVTGKVVPAKSGKDIPVPTGKNVHTAEDGVTVIADINGQVVLAGQNINVEPVYKVDGNVNLKTGNIIFLGTVIVNGNVEDGFSVKAAGNIEVMGTVEKAELDAEGDIIVHQGITGKEVGTIRAGRSIWSRFAENVNIEAGNMVVVSDGILNSKVDANKRIVCQGKRAQIVGGRLRAAEEINAKILGNSSGTETICEVGIDPKSKAQLESLEERRIELDREFKRIQKDIQTLLAIKKQRKALPEDKESFLKELVERRQELVKDLQSIKAEIQKLQDFLDRLTIRSKVSAATKVYPGVKVIIRDTVNEVRTDYRAVTFILENNLVKVSKYEEVDDEAKKGPDGYTTD